MPLWNFFSSNISWSPGAGVSQLFCNEPDVKHFRIHKPRSLSQLSQYGLICMIYSSKSKHIDTTKFTVLHEKKDRIYSLILLIRLERYPGEENSYPFQYFCLENPMDIGALWATVQGSQRVEHDWATKHSTALFISHY